MRMRMWQYFYYCYRLRAKFFPHPLPHPKIRRMFDFEKLRVYQKAEDFHYEICEQLQNINADPYFKDQLRRASASITLNIAEGAGRFSPKDKRRFYVMARGSVYECVSILRILRRKELFSQDIHTHLYDNLTELSKMLMGLIR